MDPITLATITSGVSLLAAECGKGLASEAGKSAWGKIKSLLGWGEDPAPPAIAPAVATRLANDDALAREILAALRSTKSENNFASQLVGSIDAEKVVVAGQFNVAGNFQM